MNDLICRKTLKTPHTHTHTHTHTHNRTNQHMKISYVSVHYQLTVQKRNQENYIHKASKRIKYSGVKLTNGVKDLYTENLKIMLKHFKEDRSK